MNTSRKAKRIKGESHSIRDIELQRVVITGMGVLTPIGNTVEEYWGNLIAGCSGVERITKFDPSDFSSQIAGEVKGFQPLDYMDRKDARRMDIFAQYAVAVAKMAVADAGLDLSNEDPERIGVVVGSGIGGIGTWERQYKTLLEKGPMRLSPFFIPMMIIDMAPGQVAIALNAKGPNYSTVSACASGAHAIGDSFRILQRGDADVMITGGAEASITPLSMAGFCTAKALSTRNHAPQEASRPFDAQRDGFIMGEGAGTIILETLDHARKRKARIYAELVGLGMTDDAHHMTAPSPNGEGAAKAMELALRDGGIRPEEVDYINAHGTSTPFNDSTETKAIKSVFGEYSYKVPISATKSMVGHLLGAAGATELIATVKSIQESILHPTINYQYRDPDCDLDYVPNRARPKEVKIALSNSFGFGGHNVCLALRKFAG